MLDSYAYTGGEFESVGDTRCDPKGDEWIKGMAVFSWQLTATWIAGDSTRGYVGVFWYPDRIEPALFSCHCQLIDWHRVISAEWKEANAHNGTRNRLVCKKDTVVDEPEQDGTLAAVDYDWDYVEAHANNHLSFS